MKKLDSNSFPTTSLSNPGNFRIQRPCIQNSIVNQAKSSEGDVNLEIDQKVETLPIMSSAYLVPAKLQQEPQNLVKDPPKMVKHFIQKPIIISQAPAVQKPMGLQIQSVFSLQGMFSQTKIKNPKMQMASHGTNRQRLLLPKPENDASD